MSILSKLDFLKERYGRGLTYYLLFNIVFLLSHLALVSIFSFFHFLLDHDLNTIENWLIRNSWEVIILSKLASLSFLIILIDNVNYQTRKVARLVKDIAKVPSRSSFVFTLFLAVFFYILISQFATLPNQEQSNVNLTYSSFIGASLFYLIDFVLISMMKQNFKMSRKEYKHLYFPYILLFFGTTKILLPYLSQFFLLQLLHFSVLFVFGMTKKFSDSIVYALFIIAPISSLYGLDIVWENAYSAVNSSTKLPHIGIIGFWAVGLIYYYRTRVRGEALEQRERELLAHKA